MKAILSLIALLSVVSAAQASEIGCPTTVQLALKTNEPVQLTDLNVPGLKTLKVLKASSASQTYIVVVRDATGQGNFSACDVQSVVADTQSGYVGQIISIFGPGGETTGFGLQQDNGRILEVMPSNGIDLSIGERVAVNGYFVDKRGVEIKTRKIFVITSLSPLTVTRN